MIIKNLLLAGFSKVIPIYIDKSGKWFIGKELCDIKIFREGKFEKYDYLSRWNIDNEVKGKMVFYVGKGCKACDESGYLGRVGIHEVMEVEDEIRDGIMHRANADEIRTIAVKNGMTTMIQDGFSKVLEGLTTVEEILRVIHE